MNDACIDINVWSEDGSLEKTLRVKVDAKKTYSEFPAAACSKSWVGRLLTPIVPVFCPMARQGLCRWDRLKSGLMT